MAGETRLYSGMNISAPWRGVNVHPSDAGPYDQLPAVMFLVGLDAAAVSAVSGSGKQFIGEIQQFSTDAIMDTSMGQG